MCLAVILAQRCGKLTRRCAERALDCGPALLFGAACSLLAAPFKAAEEGKTDMGAPNIIRVGTVVAAAFAMMLAGGSAGAQQAVKFSLDFKFEGPSAPFVVGLDRGYYKAEGLDVT